MPGSDVPKSRLTSRGWLIAGSVVSVALHALGAAAIVDRAANGGGAQDAASIDRSEDRRPAPAPNQERLGIDTSRAVTINWLGFEEATPFDAPVADTEQAAMSVASAAPPPAEPVTPSPEASAASVSRPPAEATPIVEATAEPEVDLLTERDPRSVLIVDEREGASSAIAATGDEPASGELLRPAPIDEGEPQESEALATTKAEPTPDQTNRPVREAAPPTRATQPSEPRPQQTPAEPTVADPGRPADRQSDATVVERPIDVREWGAPVAAQGLKIKTVRPDMTVTTAIMTSNRPATVRIWFLTKDGSVDEARFVKDEEGRNLSTGSTVRDSDLLDAVYNWKVSGERFEKIRSERGPDHRIEVVMRVYFIQ
ncbi:MAG: hypothetical protein CMJ31_07190 [Phycisphaerae bacterium]|nr:hypothetical protein [Phycisphaerae bacterium]